MKTERLDKLLSRLGYGSRKDVRFWLKEGWVTVDGEVPKSPATKVDPQAVQVEGEPLDHPFGLTVIYHKPVGATCSHKEAGRLIYEDFPERWADRNPPLASVGRLDKETSGLLILTDDGQLNHRLTSPKHRVPKTYRAVLARPLQGGEEEAFAAGTLMLEGEETPCLPAELTVLGENEALLTLHEGRYHQARRMFAAVGNHVEQLGRIAIGGLTLEATGLAPGEYRDIEPEKLLTTIGEA